LSGDHRIDNCEAGFGYAVEPAANRLGKPERVHGIYCRSRSIFSTFALSTSNLSSNPSFTVSLSILGEAEQHVDAE
jgi:hypothetical protein